MKQLPQYANTEDLLYTLRRSMLLSVGFLVTVAFGTVAIYRLVQGKVNGSLLD